MAEPVVVLGREELRELVRDAVREALEERPRAPEWIDTAAAAELLQVTPRHVTKLAKSGELPGTQLGKLWRFRRADVEALLEQG